MNKNSLIVLILVLCGTSFYLFNKTSSEDQFFKKQAECAKVGAKYDEKFREDAEDTFESPNFANSEYVYSKKINSCVFYGEYIASEEKYGYSVLVDLYSNKIISEIRKDYTYQSLLKSSTEDLKIDRENKIKESKSEVDFWNTKRELFNGVQSENDKEYLFGAEHALKVWSQN